MKIKKSDSSVFKEWVREITELVFGKEEKPKNLKLIALCLAFEVANADNDIDDREMDLILEKIKNTIDISVLNEKEIYNVIKEESDKRVSFYDIIHDIIKEIINARERARGAPRRACVYQHTCGQVHTHSLPKHTFLSKYTHFARRGALVSTNTHVSNYTHSQHRWVRDRRSKQVSLLTSLRRWCSWIATAEWHFAPSL